MTESDSSKRNPWELQGQVFQVELDKLIPAEWNPNEMDDEEFNRLTQELEESGFLDPLQVIPMGGEKPGYYRVLGGHHRIEGAKVLGWPSAPCVILEDPKFLDEDLQKFINMRLNVIKGRISPNKFVALYQDLSKRYEHEVLSQLMGFADEGKFNELLKDIRKQVKDGNLPDHVKDKIDDTLKEVKTIDDISNVLNYLFSNYGSTLDYGFMVLMYGGKEHIYVSLEDKKLRANAKALVDICGENKVGIEAFFKELMTDEAVKKFRSNLPGADNEGGANESGVGDQQ